MTTISTPPATIREGVLRARKAQKAWEQTSVRQRLRSVRALRHLLVAECDSLCAALARDLDKTPDEGVGGDVLPLADACAFLEREGARLLRPRRVPRRQRPLWMWGQSDTVHRRPRGVIGIIGTWNYPLYLNGVQITQALTAGNAVVWKPSEVAPASAAALQDLFRKAGFPDDLLTVLPATPEAGQELTEAAIDHVVFTGSATTGRQIARRLGERLISSTLELSGCDAQFVLEDADLRLASRAAWFGVTLNRGQTCLAVRRVLVQRPVYAAFCAALAELARDAAPQPLALAAQSRLARELVQAAVADGGRLLAAAPEIDPDPPQRSRPAVVVDCRPDMRLCREASFAPIVAVLPFDTIEDALAMDAACHYALGASIFSRDARRAAVLAARLRPGVVTINDVIVPTVHPGTPFGGRGDSGWGVTQGAEGLLEMTIPQVVSCRAGTFRPHYDLAAGKGKDQGDLLRGFLESAHAPTLAGRWGGWRRLFRAVWRSR